MRPARDTLIAVAASIALLTSGAACRHSRGGAPAASVTDVDGNTYPTVAFGTLVWLGANLRATHTSSGATLAAFAPNDDPGNVPLFGRLYTWEAALRACPAGWRLPSDDDWSRLEARLGPAAGSLLRHPAPSPATAAPAFPLAPLSFPPAGYHNDEGFESFFGSRAVLWTATPQDDHFVWSRVITSTPPYLRKAPQHPQYAFSVRCVLEEVSLDEPVPLRPDEAHSKVARRFTALGSTDAGRLLFTSFTVRRHLIRVISARDTTRRKARGGRSQTRQPAGFASPRPPPMRRLTPVEDAHVHVSCHDLETYENLFCPLCFREGDTRRGRLPDESGHQVAGASAGR